MPKACFQHDAPGGVTPQVSVSFVRYSHPNPSPQGGGETSVRRGWRALRAVTTI
jgi:hypothetical protein